MKWVASFGRSRRFDWWSVRPNFRPCGLQGWSRMPTERSSVPRKTPRPSRLFVDLQALGRTIPEDVSLPSLRGQPPRVQGHAYRFSIVLPIYTAEGERIFTDEHLGHLYAFFDSRCGGCLVASSRSGAPFFGEYLPEGTQPI